MRNLTYLIIGVFFGIVMTKSEAVSWFRIQEMFRFESFHMYGIIGTSVIIGALGIALAKRMKWKTFDGNDWKLDAKKSSTSRYLFGGTIFGLGWALTGACPGPMFTLLGQGVFSLLIVIGFSVLGTFVYGIMRPRLPH